MKLNAKARLSCPKSYFEKKWWRTIRNAILHWSPFQHFELLLRVCRTNIEKMAYWRGTKHIIGAKRIRKCVLSPKNIGPKRKIKIRDELFLVLMKLRLGLMNEDLADRFGIICSTVSSIFNTWIKVLSKYLKGTIYYPLIIYKSQLTRMFCKFVSKA